MSTMLNPKPIMRVGLGIGPLDLKSINPSKVYKPLFFNNAELSYVLSGLYVADFKVSPRT